MIYGALKIYFIVCCIVFQRTLCHADHQIPCFFQSASSNLDYSEQKFSASDNNGIRWTCEEYSLSTSRNNDCDGFKRNFTDLVFLMNLLNYNQTTNNGSLIFNWNFNVTETDNSTLGFFLNSQDVIKKRRYCRVFLFKNNGRMTKSTQISLQTIIDGAGKIMITTLTPIVDRLYDTRIWNDGHFIPRLDNPHLLQVYFKTRDKIENYSVELISFPSNKTIIHKYVTESSFSFKNVSSGKYFFLLTPIDPKPNGRCVCYTGTERFHTCDRCNSVRSPVYEYPQYEKQHESSDSTTSWLWPVVGSVLMVCCIVIVIVIVYLLLKRKRNLTSRSQDNDGKYLVVYVIYTADHSPHIAVVEQLMNYLRSYCRCEILCSLESQVETKINELERRHFIETSVARSDIILVITSSVLCDLFKIYCINDNTPENNNRTPDDAMEALLHTIRLQKAGKLKGSVVEIQLSYAAKMEKSFESLKVDASFSLPDKVPEFLKSLQISSTDKYDTFIKNLKDSISDAVKFEKSTKEWKENSEKENNDSGIFDHSKSDQFYTNNHSGMFDSDPFHTNKQLSVSKDEDILTQNYDKYIPSHYESVDKSLINFIEIFI